MKKTDRNVLIAETTQNLFHELGQAFSRLKFSVSLEELHDRYDEAVDMIILREEDEKNCDYISGEFKISVVDEENYDCAYSLYFQDGDEEFHTLEAKSQPQKIEFLTKDFQKTLREKSVLKFEIDEPPLGSRVEYDKRVKEAQAAEKNVSV